MMRPAMAMTSATAKLLAAWTMVLAVAEAAQRYGAVPAMPDELIPRYFLDRSFPLAKRATGNCREGHHPCEEINHPGQCCDNESYCYINKDFDPKCCPIGSNCVNDSECSSDAYYCTTTSTSGSSTATETGCCPRKCAGTSQYLCATSLGGKCCGFDSECRAGGNCVQTVKPTPSSAELTPLPSGCTTSQHRCSDGEGCCDNDQSCTQVSGTAWCAAGHPTESDVEYVDGDSGSGLSDGAKAGIGIGAVVGAAIIIGLLTWLCIHKRRERRRTATQPSGTSQDGQDEDAAAMTEATQSSRPQQASHGLTRDYFGPDPVAGPFTETVHSARTSPGPHRAVPSQPDQPGDIAAPVEIDSEAKSEGDRPSFLSSPSYQQVSPQPETIEGRFELYGGEATPPRSPSIMPTPVSYTQGREEDR